MRGEEAPGAGNTPSIYVVTDDDGVPTGMADVGMIQAQATRLAFEMATYCDDPPMLGKITADHLAEAGARAFGYVAAAALRILAEDVLDPVLMVTDRLHDVGALGHNLRAGLAQVAESAEAAARPTTPTNDGGAT